MNIHFLTLAVIASFAMSKTAAQVQGNYQFNSKQTLQNVSRNPASAAAISNDDEIVTQVNGLMNILADNYVAVFNIVQVGESMDSVDQIMNKRIANFQQKLKSIGIELENVKVDLISFVPNYDIQIENKVFSKTYNEVPAGFEMQKNVSVLYKSSSKLDDIISAAASSEIYDIVKVDYFITDLQKSLDSLRHRCLREVKAKAKSYELIGIKLDTLKKVMADDFVTVYPQTRYFSYQAFSRPSLNAAKKKSSSQPTLNEIPKPTSKFYAQVDYDQYDIVINPVITEPVVQLSYTVTIKYFLKEKQKNIYYILTPSGETKQFYPK
ncbi:MAG TPA: SIMPL domain-containing protein [Chitinophagales bacterium]|nr:SIMPL domain-containing protein [Chitinophagales bacterium]